MVRALALTDALCWQSLQCGETAAFTRQSTICAELYDFGVCAGLLEEGDFHLTQRLPPDGWLE
jgi:hypothetical protein